MVTVYSKQELKEAFSNKETKIIAKGALAESIRKKSKLKKPTEIGGLALIIGGIAAIPFTAGASSSLAIAGAGLIVGSITITTAELAILCGFALGAYGISRGCKIKFSANGSVEIDPVYSKK
ncbi:MAG: hypothetical protein IKM93_08085 [Bacteroidales bacterium]|nr:hypothetical protein [Bacteroidales bacterium]